MVSTKSFALALAALALTGAEAKKSCKRRTSTNAAGVSTTPAVNSPLSSTETPSVSGAIEDTSLGVSLSTPIVEATAVSSTPSTTPSTPTSLTTDVSAAESSTPVSSVELSTALSLAATSDVVSLSTTLNSMSTSTTPSTTDIPSSTPEDSITSASTSELSTTAASSTITSAPACTATGGVNLFSNPSFESGDSTPWIVSQMAVKRIASYFTPQDGNYYIDAVLKRNPGGTVDTTTFGQRVIGMKEGSTYQIKGWVSWGATPRSSINHCDVFLSGSAGNIGATTTMVPALSGQYVQLEWTYQAQMDDETLVFWNTCVGNAGASMWYAELTWDNLYIEEICPGTAQTTQTY